MAEGYKTGTTTTTTESSWPPITTTASSSYSRASQSQSKSRSQGQSILETPGTSNNSDQSIEEEIEEAIEASGSLSYEGEVAEERKDSLDLASDLSGSKEAFVPLKKKANHLDLFGIGSADVSEADDESSKNPSLSHEQFKIEDDELSGGHLKQHFTIPPDDEDEEDEDEIDLGPQEKHDSPPPAPSRHSSNIDLGKTSPNPSTAEDISDIHDDLRKSKSNSFPSEESDSFEIPLPEDGNNDVLPMDKILKKLNETKCQAKPTKDNIKLLEKSDDEYEQFKENLVGNSPEHSEKDLSIEELIETNASLEMTVEEKDTSSMNKSQINESHDQSHQSKMDDEPIQETSQQFSKISQDLSHQSSHRTLESHDAESTEVAEKSEAGKMEQSRDLSLQSGHSKHSKVEDDFEETHSEAADHSAQSKSGKIEDDFEPSHQSSHRTLDSHNVESTEVAQDSALSKAEKLELDLEPSHDFSLQSGHSKHSKVEDDFEETHSEVAHHSVQSKSGKIEEDFEPSHDFSLQSGQSKLSKVDDDYEETHSELKNPSPHQYSLQASEQQHSVENENFEEKSSQMVTDLDETISDHDSSKEPINEEQKSFKESQMITILDDFPEESSMSIGVEEEMDEHSDEDPQNNADDDDEDDTSLKLMKVRILAMQNQPKESVSPEPPANPITNMISPNLNFSSFQEVKQMERIPLSEFTKDVLEDITEESERNSLSTTIDEQHSMSFEKDNEHKSLEDLTPRVENPYSNLFPKETSEPADPLLNEESSSTSIVSLNMMKVLEQKVTDLQSVLESKDACLASLQMQIESLQRRESSSTLSNAEPPISGRDSSSLVTTSTEYRTFQEDFGVQTMDTYMELMKRDELIAKLTDSLQQSLNAREKLQSQSDKLNAEVQSLRKQIGDAMESYRKPAGLWSRAGDLESNAGQRLSEISMDLVSESDDDLDRQFLTDNEEKYSRNSKERQGFEEDLNQNALSFDWNPPFNKQIEQFQKYLTPSEIRLFHMVQKKFDDYLTKELDQARSKSEQEMKSLLDKLKIEKQQKDAEIEKLLALRTEKDTMHSKEMEDLRKYFENKCADLEKQFSDDVFSQKSLLQGDSSGSECSDRELMPEESTHIVKEMSPRKRARTVLLNSPSHRQMTPFSIDTKDDNENMELKDLKAFYKTKIQELHNSHEDVVRRLNEKLKYYESRYPDDDYMKKDSGAVVESEVEKIIKIAKVNNNFIHLNESNEDNNNDIGSTNVIQNLSIESNKSDKVLPRGLLQEAEKISEELNTSLIIIDQDEISLNNESQIIQKIIAEYEKRLQEQLALAREDIVHELEQQIQNLLSETTADDQHWPKELILLREKFTAKSQLEIAQLQIKHAEEMSRLKLEYETQMNRKLKRNVTFDSGREYNQVLCERDGLRELSKSFRQVLSELARCVSSCEDDLNITIAEEVQRQLSNRTLDDDINDLDQTINISLANTTLNSTYQRNRFVPDVQGILELVDNPSLLQYMSNNSSNHSEDFDLNECLERLNKEASYLLHLSEDFRKRHKRSDSESSGGEKSDSCCEAEDGLKMKREKQNQKFSRAHSFNEQQLSIYPSHKNVMTNQLFTSLPSDFKRLPNSGGDMGAGGDYSSGSGSAGNASELNFQMIELKNRLIKSETDRNKLQRELENTITRNSELGQELKALRDQLSNLNSLNQTEYTEGYGLGSSMKSPPLNESSLHNISSSFLQLQEKARNLLTSPSHNRSADDSTVALLQMIEDFCREGDKILEVNKKDREDLQSQFEHQESQLRDLTQKLNEANAKRDKFEVELKASIDKIFVLREIISDLETQLETKALNEDVLNEKVKQLEDFINSQTRSNETLQNEVLSLKTEIDNSYQARILQLEEKLQNIRPTAEQNMVMELVVEQLKDIENTLEQKTKTLESLHNSSGSSDTGSLTEDVSAQRTRPTSLPLANVIVSPPQGSPVHPSPRQHSLTMEGVQRVVDKLSKHSRVEEAAIKRIHDLEMQLSKLRTLNEELQRERDCLQEHMCEQTARISSLQVRLEEQRQRAEVIHRSNTNDLNIRIHDLHNEVENLRETLSNREKQIAGFKEHLQKSKEAIDSLEEELRNHHGQDESKVQMLEEQIRVKDSEIEKLKEKLKEEMLKKYKMPDLMQTMLDDKNEEIDHLKNKLVGKEKELQVLMELNLSQGSNLSNIRKANGTPKEDGGEEEDLTLNKEEVCTKLSARTLSDIVSLTEYDEPDVMRRAAVLNTNTPLILPEGSQGGATFVNTMETSKEALADLTHKRTEDLSGFVHLHPVNTFEHPHYFQDPNLLQSSKKSLTPCGLVPRQINFSDLSEDSKCKTPLTFNNEEDDAKEKTFDLDKKEEELRALQKDLMACKEEIEKLQKMNSDNIDSILEKSRELEQLQKSYNKQNELLTKQEKDILNYKENMESYEQKIKDLEQEVLQTVAREVEQRDNLRKELEVLNEVHAQCKYTLKDVENRKKEIDHLNQEIKEKDDRLLQINAKFSLSEEKILELQEHIVNLEKDIERLKQQLQSESSSRQFSVDEIAQQVEKELNYSAQLDSNILKAIESEEENNLDCMQKKLKTQQMEQRQLQAELVKQKTESQGTDDENFTGERDLLNQVEVLKAQSDSLKQELSDEKLHSQEIQKQDVLIIEAIRSRLESALEKEDELLKQLDMERERCDHLQTQLTALQRSESRRSSSFLLKSPTDSPRKTPRATNDFESELAERLRSEIKILTAQNERERERFTDLQKNAERDRQRYEMELQERIDYCERLKKEMDKLSRDKENSEQEIEHLQERLTLQTTEIETLEARLVTLQESETRRTNRHDRHQKESAKLLAELQEIKTKLASAEMERENLSKTIALMRFDMERSSVREAKLAESLASANAQLANAAEATASVPQQFMQKMKEINTLLAENTRENRQMAETVQFLVEERRQLQKKCEKLESQLTSNAANGTKSTELEERCNYLLGRYLRNESHRKALVYQKRYLKLSLQRYLDNEQKLKEHLQGPHAQRTEEQQRKKKLFKTVALSVIAIQRMKYISRMWHNGKRIVSKSIFTVTQQKRPPPASARVEAPTSPGSPIVSCPIVSSSRNQTILHSPQEEEGVVNIATLLNGTRTTPVESTTPRKNFQYNM